MALEPLILKIYQAEKETLPDPDGPLLALSEEVVMWFSEKQVKEYGEEAGSKISQRDKLRKNIEGIEACIAIMADVENRTI